MKIPDCFLLILLLALLLAPVRGAPAQAVSPSAETIILCDPADPYYTLAEEIARADGLSVVHTWAEALARDPLYLLWVVAPDQLSDPLMAQAGQALQGAKTLPALGVITGSSREQAAALWQRGAQRRQEAARGAKTGPGMLFAANGEYPTAGIPRPRLIAFHPPATGTTAAAQEQTQELTVSSMAGALAQADYLTFTGHGSGRYLYIEEGVKFGVQDLPDLPPVVVSTGSCQTFRPWVEDSLLLGFLQHGAAAYAGFVFSPMEGYLMGEFRDLPFRYTWPEFPIGRVVALQNQGTLRGFAGFPYHYLAGDPRIALTAQPPYRLLSDENQNGRRVLSYTEVPAGLVPVRVSGGAAYQFVDVPGVGSAASGDIFFNARLQTMDARGDKYILFLHPGGPFSIRLRAAPPWHWRVTRPLLDAFDNVVLFTPQNGGDMIIIAAGPLALALGTWRAWRRRSAMHGGWRRLALTCLTIGAGTTLALGIYAGLRLPHTAVTTKPLFINYPWLLGAGMLAGAGMLLTSCARSRLAKILAVVVAALPALFPGLFVLAAMGGFNIIAASQIGAGIYGYRMAIQSLLAAGVEMLVFAAVYDI